VRPAGHRGVRPGLYIHVPYCRSKCAYCSFNSVESAAGVPEAYIGALLGDMRNSAPAWDGVEFGSLYVGGGTPSLLGPEGARRILSEARVRFRLATGAEVTLECNPGSLDRADIGAYMDLGVNRLSVGVQSLSRRELGLLGRRHTPEDALRCLRDARAVGLPNISCDVIVGVPGQDPASLEATLSGVMPLAGHISCYLLSVDPGTPLHARVEAGALREQHEDDLVRLLETAGRVLGRGGFHRYEISNWSRPGLESVHNRMYWARGDYLGLGAGAASHRSGLRSARFKDPAAYIASVGAGKEPLAYAESLTRGEMLLEEVMLGLRTSRGLDLGSLVNDFGCDAGHASALVSQLAESGLVVTNGHAIQLSAKGMLLSDAVIGEMAANLAVE
jgi:oxygen-independent coproporphyrinogen-3 oxidase